MSTATHNKQRGVIDHERIRCANTSDILVYAVQSQSVKRLQAVLNTLGELYRTEEDRARVLRAPLKDMDVTAVHVAVRLFAVHHEDPHLRLVFNKMVGLLLEAGADYTSCHRTKLTTWVEGKRVDYFANDGITVFELCKGDVPPLLMAYIQEGLNAREDFLDQLNQLQIEEPDPPQDDPLVQRLHEIYQAKRKRKQPKPVDSTPLTPEEKALLKEQKAEARRERKREQSRQARQRAKATHGSEWLPTTDIRR